MTDRRSGAVPDAGHRRSAAARPARPFKCHCGNLVKAHAPIPNRCPLPAAAATVVPADRMVRGAVTKGG